MKIIFLMLTSDRFQYTKESVAALLANAFRERHIDSYPCPGKLDNDTLVPEDAVEPLVDILDRCPLEAVCRGRHWSGVNFPARRLVNVDERLLLKAKWGGGCFYGIRSSAVRRKGWKVVYAYPPVWVRHSGKAASGSSISAPRTRRRSRNTGSSVSVPTEGEESRAGSS